MHISFDYDKVRHDAALVIEAWQNSGSWLMIQDPPEITFHPVGVKIGSREHALYLFHAGYASRSGKTADKVISEIGKIAISHPHLLDPRQAELGSFDLYHVLPRALAFTDYDPGRITGWWDNLKKLRQVYDSDPRNIFLNLDLNPDCKISIMEARQTLISRLCNPNFYGIREKIAQLIIPWFQAVKWDDNLSEWEAIRQIPAIPTDIHMMRVVKQWGWVTSYSTDHRDQIHLPISNYIANLCLNEGYSAYDLVQGMWHIAARICATYRQKRDHYPLSVARQYCYDSCPAFSFCQGIVPTNVQKTGRGRILWDEFIEHPITSFNIPLIECPRSYNQKDSIVELPLKVLRKEKTLKLSL